MEYKQCPICGKECSSLENMVNCFQSHTEHEQLVWSAKELHRITEDCYNVFSLVDGVVAKYHLDD